MMDIMDGILLGSWAITGRQQCLWTVAEQHDGNAEFTNDDTTCNMLLHIL